MHLCVILLPLLMETITHREHIVFLQVEVRESIRMILKSKAALVGKTMGEYITDLIERDGLMPQAPGASGTSPGAHRRKPAHNAKEREGE